MTKRRARRIRNLTRFWNGSVRRKQPLARTRFCVYCPALLRTN